MDTHKKLFLYFVRFGLFEFDLKTGFLFVQMFVSKSRLILKVSFLNNWLDDGNLLELTRQRFFQEISRMWPPP